MNRNIKYKRSKKGQVTKIYSNQKQLSVKRGYALPNYTKDELEVWLYSQENFSELYDAWVLSDYDTKLAPSCDRINDYAPYTLDNIVLTTWCENANKSYKDTKSGKNSKRNKTILQFDMQGNLLNEYPSSMDAERATKNKHSHITNCCNGKHAHIGGYLWKYKEVA